MAYRSIAAALLVATSASAQLLPRDLDGDGAPDAYYSASQDITWLRDGDYAATIGFDPPSEWGAHPVGWMSAGQQFDWITSLTIGDVSGWRMPHAIGDPACPFEYCGVLSTDFDGLPASFGTGASPFINVQPGGYYLLVLGVEEYASRWAYGHTVTHQSTFPQPAWPVHDGDVGIALAVPEPETWALMLLGAAFIAWRRHGLLPNSKAPMSRAPTAL